MEEELKKLEYQPAQSKLERQKLEAERQKLETQLSKATGNTQVELLKIRTQNSAVINEVISRLEPFTGVVGDIEHFIKDGDQIKSLITTRQETGTLLESDVKILEASLIGRI